MRNNKLDNSQQNSEQLFKKESYRVKLKAPIQQNDSPNLSMSSASATFSQGSTETRSLWKAKKALLRSPNKKKDVVGSVCKKIQPPLLLQLNRGRKKPDPEEEERFWLSDILDRLDVSLGKIDCQKKFAQKQYLL